jgi:MYXO-CTERM domain-containing protein
MDEKMRSRAATGLMLIVLGAFGGGRKGKRRR